MYMYIYETYKKYTRKKYYFYLSDNLSTILKEDYMSQNEIPAERKACRNKFHLLVYLPTLIKRVVNRKNSSQITTLANHRNVGGPSPTQTGFRPPSLFGTRVLAR